MVKQIYNYLVLKIVKLKEKNDLYKNIYRVTDETGKLNLLGYYDEKKKDPVLILTNKSVLEYDWNGIAMRVKKLSKDYCNKFTSTEKLIIITEEAKTEEVGQNFVIKDNIMFITEHRYINQFKEENTINVVEETKTQKSWFSKFIHSIYPFKHKTNNEKAYNEFTVNNTNTSLKPIIFAAFFTISLASFFVYLHYNYEKKFKNVEIDPAFLSSITQTKTKTVFDSLKILDTIVIPDTIALNHNFKLTIQQQRLADSLAKEKHYTDSVNMYLKLHRKIKVTLHSSINDGYTERTAKTEMVTDSLRAKDVAQLTTVINQMTKEMNNERLEELKANKFIDVNNENSFVIGMSKEKDNAISR